MKPTCLLRAFLAVTGSSIFAVSSATAANRYWSGAGNWDTTNQVWGIASGGTYDQAIWNNAGNDTAIFEGTAGTVTLLEGITVGGLTFNTAGYSVTGNTLTLASGTIIHSTVGTNNSTDPVITSALSGSNGFTKTGSGWLGLEATTSSLSGNINISAGTLYTRHEALGSGDIVFTGNSTLTKVYNANSNFTQDIAINDNVTATLSAASFYYNANHAGVLSGGTTATLNLSLGGNTEFQFNNTANTFTGKLIIGTGGTADNGGRAVFKSLADSTQKIQINNALLRLANGGTSMNFASRQLEMLTNNARLDNDSTNASVTMSFSQDLLATIGNNARTLILSGVNTGNNTFSGVIGNSATGSGAVSVQKLEAGKWILGSNNTYTGKTSVQTGTLEVASLKNLNTASSVGMNNILQLGYYNTAGTLRYVGTGDSTDRPIQVNDYTNGTGNTASGIIRNDGTGALTFTAPTFIPTNETVVANRALELGGTYTGGTNTIQGIIQDIAPIANKAIISVVKRNDSSIWALSGTNTYTGGTTVSGGTLTFLNTNAKPASGTHAFAAGTTLGLGVSGASAFTASDVTNAFAGSMTGNLSGITVTATTDVGIDTSNGDFSYSDDITGSPTKGLTKLGGNTLTLAGNHTYTGATTIRGGTLTVSGTGDINSTSSITVAGGASFVYNSSTALTVTPTLDGSVDNRAVFSGSGNLGTVALTLDSIDDVLSPGNSPGTQAFGTAQTWASFSYDWELNDWTSLVAGASFDQITINGSLDLSAVAADQYLLNLLSLTGGNVTGDVPGFAETSRSWAILTTSAGITGFDASEWDIITAGFTNGETGTWSLGLANSDQDLVLSYAPIPEPGTALLGGLGVLFLLRRRRN